MNKILIINQHTNNHGDEAAGLALIRELKSVRPQADIGILYNWHEKIKDEGLIGKHEFEKVKHYSFSTSKFTAVLVRLSIFIPQLALFFSKLNLNLKKQRNIIKSYDVIINGPGGVNIGPYKDYNYLWRLLLSKELSKKIVIYSISFGPLNGLPKFFRKRSKEIFEYSHFISLRDKKSQTFGNELNINFHKSIDTAFLSIKDETIPDEYSLLNNSEYVVIVPNQLYKWHPYFKKINFKSMDDLYVAIAKRFIAQHKKKVVFLPQLFANQNDEEYMSKLASQVDGDTIIVDSKYSSDVQQRIIQKSQFVVGARYHTIIFSINNKTPFFALSYEHKMQDMLSILGMTNNMIDLITYFSDNKQNHNKLLNQISTQFDEKTFQNISAAQNKAISIARATFESLAKKFDF